jgi:PPM family protein phosphatase
MEVGYGWDMGLVRTLNEDSILSSTFEITSHAGVKSSGLFAVADGMGGHNAGEIASEIATSAFQAESIPALLTQTEIPPLTIMEKAFLRTNNKVLLAARGKDLSGMGTTLTAALIVGQQIFIAHIGDSRCYVINNRETLQVTKDHSLVQQLIDSGVLTPEQARVHPRRNEITRVLGYLPDAAPDLVRVQLYNGDIILLCTDGLHGVIEPDKLSETVLTASDLRQACDKLISLSNEAGGPDNISVILIKPSGLPSWQEMMDTKTFVRAM